MRSLSFPPGKVSRNSPTRNALGGNSFSPYASASQRPRVQATNFSAVRPAKLASRSSLGTEVSLQSVGFIPGWCWASAARHQPPSATSNFFLSSFSITAGELGKLATNLKVLANLEIYALKLLSNHPWLDRFWNREANGPGSPLALSVFQSFKGHSRT